MLEIVTLRDIDFDRYEHYVVHTDEGYVIDENKKKEYCDKRFVSVESLEDWAKTYKGANIELLINQLKQNVKRN